MRRSTNYFGLLFAVVAALALGDIQRCSVSLSFLCNLKFIFDAVKCGQLRPAFVYIFGLSLCGILYERRGEKTRYFRR